MPLAKYFRLKIYIKDKTNIKISAIHLYNGNNRVDIEATLSSGFESNLSILSILKNEYPINGQSINIDSSNLRKNQLYFIWSFTQDTEVNAFRIGSCSTINDFLSNFSLEWSSNGTDFYQFISISLDKKLAWPGEWVLSELKPEGECFPLLISRITNKNIVLTTPEVKVKDNGTTLSNTEVWPNATMLGFPYGDFASVYTPTYFEIPGFFSKGKYYFENSFLYENPTMISGVVNALSLVLVPYTNEPDVKLSHSSFISPGLALNINRNIRVNIDRSVAHSALTLTKNRFIPGFQSGFMVDFDNRELKIFKPSWSTTIVEDFIVPVSTTDMKSHPINTRYKLFIAVFWSSAFLPSNDLNFGQLPFVQTVPVGYNSGIGPRWKEELEIIPQPRENLEVNYNSNLLPYEGYDFSLLTTAVNNDIELPFLGAGCYYIKGAVTRVPNIENKRFCVSLYSINLRSIISEIILSSSGVYEFLNIDYGPYIVTSIDLRNNTVVESIGPLFPLEML